MAEDRFLETVLRTEHLTEREWLSLLELRQEDVRYWIRKLPVLKLITFGCIDRRSQGRGYIPVHSLAFSEGDQELLRARGIFSLKKPRSPKDECSFYIVGFVEPGRWLIATVFSHKDTDGAELVDRANVELAAPSHIVEMAEVSYGNLWFMLGHTVEDLAKKRREELVRLTALEQRVILQNQMVVAIETDHKVMG